MNIFKALSQGNGQISETNVTSFLSFLLNGTNEFGGTFLLLFAKHLNSLEMELNITGNKFRDKLQDFNRKYKFSAIPEVRAQVGNKWQIIDTVLTISEKNTDNDVAYILIENKIKKSAIKENQCSEQLEYFLRCEDFQENVPVYSLLITPPDKSFELMYNHILEKNIKSIWLSWTDNSLGLGSIEGIIREMINLENCLEVPPINDNSKYILKSFVEHISTELSEKTKEMNYSTSGSNILEFATYELNDRPYFLKRFDNDMIRIYDEEDNLINGMVKPILRTLIDKYELDIDIKNINTRTLGKNVIRELNKIKKCSKKLPEKTKEMNSKSDETNVLEFARYELSDKVYFLKRFDNDMIRIYDEEDNLINGMVKPILRTLIDKYKLDLNIENVNTRTLGRNVIRELNKK